MKKTHITAMAFAGILLAAFGGMALGSTGQVHRESAGGLAFSEFRGYEAWQAISTQPEREGWSR